MSADLMDIEVAEELSTMQKSIEKEFLAAQEVIKNQSSMEQGTINQVDNPTRLNCVVVGDSMVGKTSLIYSFLSGLSITDKDHYVTLPDTFGVQQKMITFERNDYILVIHDTDKHQEKRKQLYATADVIILCFSVTDVPSFYNTGGFWVSELNKFAPNKPVMLIGCKGDMRQIVRPYLETVGHFGGAHMCVYINAQAWFDCSAKTLEGVNQVFHDVPNCFERFKRLQAWQRRINAQPRAVNIGTQGFGQLFLAAINTGVQQSYQNVRDCWMNPGAFVEKKKTLTTYIPPLRRYLPYEKDGMSVDKKIKFPYVKSGVSICQKNKHPLAKSMSEVIEQKIPLVSSISEAFDHFSIKELLAKRKTNDESDQPGPSETNCNVPVVQEPRSPLSILASAIDDFYLTQIMNIRDEYLNEEENKQLTANEFFFSESSAPDPITKSISKTIERFKKKRLFGKKNSDSELLKSRKIENDTNKQVNGNEEKGSSL